jgi:thiamine biosynthesis lipoprotein ApbE
LHHEVLSVSGNSLNNRKKFANSGHILNPHTLRLIRPLGLVAVKSADPVEGEVYSTALFSAGREQTEGMLKNAGSIEVHWSGGSEEA